MANRIQSRREDGRFRQGTMENTFGLHVHVCPNCRTCNPYKVGEIMPTTCHACGESLARSVDPMDAAGDLSPMTSGTDWHDDE